MKISNTLEGQIAKSKLKSGVAGPRSEAHLEMFSDLHTLSESLQEKLLPKIGFRYPPLCLVYISSTTMSLITTALLGEQDQAT